MRVVGRGSELGQARTVLSSLMEGPVALVFEGEAGIGKTAVWEAAVAEAETAGCRVLATRAGEADAAIAFAGLIGLVEDAAERALPFLPSAQQVALGTVVFDSEARVDPLALGLAVRNLLRQEALAAPVVVAIDDLQWLDAPSARTLGFAFRRLADEHVGLLATHRVGTRVVDDPTAAFPPGRVTREQVGPLDQTALARILDERLELTLPRAQLRALDDASAGNPFFALELARSVQAGKTRLVPGAPPALAPSLQELLASHLEQVPPEVADALLTVAARIDPTVDDLRPEMFDAAEDAGLVVAEGKRIRFAHPLLRSAVYERATAGARRRRHLELAARVEDVYERAFHLALATVRPDEDVARDLEAAAERTARRGAPDGAAELFLHAARLSVDPAGRNHRDLRGVEELLWAGERDRADALLRKVEHAVDRGPQRAHTRFLRAEWAEDLKTAGDLLRLAYEEAEGDDVMRARVQAGLTHLEHEVSFERSYRSAQRLLELSERAGRRDLLVAATASMIFISFATGRLFERTLAEHAMELEEAMNADGEEAVPSARQSYAEFLTYSGHLAEARVLLEQQVRRAQETGHRSSARFHLGFLEWRAGAPALAARHARAVAEEAFGPGAQALGDFIEAFACATMGDLDGAVAAVEASDRHLEKTGRKVELVGGRFVRAFIASSRDDFEEAARRAEEGIAIMRELGWREVGVHPIYQERAEALVALGRLEEAEATLDELERLARPIDRIPALAGALRGRGALAAAHGDYDAAVERCTAALELQATAPEPFELARTRLVRGTALRRAQKRAAAAADLTEAQAAFERIGAPLWAAKARSELGRIGGRPSRRGLTASEDRIAALVAAGRTNREVATALFLSVKTVEWNLSKIYRKLGVGSRTELAAKLAGRTASVVANASDVHDVDLAGDEVASAVGSRAGLPAGVEPRVRAGPVDD